MTRPIHDYMLNEMGIALMFVVAQGTEGNTSLQMMSRSERIPSSE
jgi:hypothetical protein